MPQLKRLGGDKEATYELVEEDDPEDLEEEPLQANEEDFLFGADIKELGVQDRRKRTRRRERVRTYCPKKPCICLITFCCASFACLALITAAVVAAPFVIEYIKKGPYVQIHLPIDNRNLPNPQGPNVVHPTRVHSSASVPVSSSHHSGGPTHFTTHTMYSPSVPTSTNYPPFTMNSSVEHTHAVHLTSVDITSMSSSQRYLTRILSSSHEAGESTTFLTRTSVTPPTPSLPPGWSTFMPWLSTSAFSPSEISPSTEQPTVVHSTSAVYSTEGTMSTERYPSPIWSSSHEPGKTTAFLTSSSMMSPTPSHPPRWSSSSQWVSTERYPSLIWSSSHKPGKTTAFLTSSSMMSPTPSHPPRWSSSSQWVSTESFPSLTVSSFGPMMSSSSHMHPMYTSTPLSSAAEQGSTMMTGSSALEPTAVSFSSGYVPSQTLYPPFWSWSSRAIPPSSEPFPNWSTRIMPTQTYSQSFTYHSTSVNPSLPHYHSHWRSLTELQSASGSYLTYGGGSTTVEQSPTPEPSPLPKTCGSVDEVCKPLTDQSEYRVITLSNSLRVLLVSNNETSTSAAAVDVYSGSFNDGDIEGLAHFCEHMLFLGTEKYPDEGSYSKYLSTNGGYDNAYTSSENTNYYLSVNSDKLEGALDRLAQFFVSPLFNESGVDREKNAVNSEYQKDRGIPGWIDYLVMKTVAVPASPYSKFTTGSLETFNVSDLVDRLRAYYNKRYSANLMQVAIYGRDDLDTLQNWATKYFGDIPNKNLFKPHPPFPPYSGGYTSRIIVYKPLGSTPFVNVVWQTPSLQKKYRNHVTDFLEKLFTFKGNGSLDSALREKGWTTSLDFEIDRFSNFVLYSLTIKLTSEGENSLKEIVSMVFGYVKHLKNSDSSELERVWRSLKDLEQLKFDYSDPPSDIPRYASGLADKMRTTKDPVDFLSPPERFLWDPYLVETVFNWLTPDYTNIFYAKPSLTLNPAAAPPSNNGTCWSIAPNVVRHGLNVSSVDQVEPVFGTPYGVYCTPVELIEMWENVPALEGARLPRFDMFVPTELSLLPIPVNFTGVPEKILDNQEGSTVWWMQDSQFQNPVQIFRCEAETPIPGESPLYRALSSLYKKYFSLVLSEVEYYGELANYKVTLDLTYRGVFLEFTGYSDHNVMKSFMRTVLERLVDISPSTLSARGDLLQLALLQAVQELREYTTSKLPYQYVRDFILTTLEDPNFYYKAILNELESLDSSWGDLADQVATFMKSVLNSISNCTCYSTGNVDRNQSLSYADLVHQTLMKDNSSLLVATSERKVLMLPKGVTAFTIPTLNPTKDPNSAIYVVDQVGPVCEVEVDPGDGTPVTCTEQSLNNTVYSGVLDLLIGDACFDQLRTKEQLGYAVSCGTSTVDNLVTVIYFLVQSAVQPPPYLLNRTWEFVHSFRKSTVKDPNVFHKAVSAYKTLLQAKDKTLEDQVKRIWRQISTRKFRFQNAEALTAVADKLTPDGFLKFYKKFITDRDSGDGSSGSVRELVIGAFQNVTSLQFYQISHDRQYQLEELTSFKNNTADFWDA